MHLCPQLRLWNVELTAQLKDSPVKTRPLIQRTFHVLSFIWKRMEAHSGTYHYLEAAQFSHGKHGSCTRPATTAFIDNNINLTVNSHFRFWSSLMGLTGTSFPRHILPPGAGGRNWLPVPEGGSARAAAYRVGEMHDVCRVEQHCDMFASQRCSFKLTLAYGQTVVWSSCFSLFSYCISGQQAVSPGGAHRALR